MIFICQYLCPKRHCIVALAYDPAGTTVDQVEETLKKAMADNKVDPWCGLCRSTDLKFEHERTRFNTMEEAMPFFKVEEAKQAFTRTLLNPD